MGFTHPGRHYISSTTDPQLAEVRHFAMPRWRDVVRPEATTRLEDDYHLSRVLGKGAFGTVRLAVDKRTGAERACKSISKSRLVSQGDVDDVRREVELLHLLTPHPTVAELVGVYEDRGAVHIVMEFCAGGELFDRIVQRRTLSEAVAARFFRRMVEMVRHCHACGVMHRDIKPENFLLTDPGDDADLKACDFGLSAFFKHNEMLSSLVGSAYYVAPEVLRRRYGPPADLWSLGCVLYILLSGIPPFWGPTDKDIFTSVLRGRVDFAPAPWPSVSNAAKDLVQRLLTLDPAQRITAEECLHHPWLRDQGVAPDAPLDSIVLQRMKGFAGLTKLKKATVLAAAQHLGREEINGLRELFKSFDTDGDGQVTLDELRAGLRLQGAALSDEEVSAVMRETDVDGSGAIDYNEFLAATVNMALLEREDVLHKLFDELDADGSGTLTLEELEAALGRSELGAVDRSEVIDLMRRADANGDGVVDFAEFVAEWRQSSGGGAAAAHAANTLRRGLSAVAEQMDIDVE